MALLTVQTISHAGINPTYAACDAGGDLAPNDGRTFIHIKNAHTSSQSITIASPKKCSQNFQHDVVVSVTNAQERLIGPFPKGEFDNAVGQLVLTYSGVTALTIAILRLTETGR